MLQLHSFIRACPFYTRDLKSNQPLKHKVRDNGGLAIAHRICWAFSILHILHKPSHNRPFPTENVHEVFTQPGGAGVDPAPGASHARWVVLRNFMLVPHEVAD